MISGNRKDARSVKELFEGLNSGFDGNTVEGIQPFAVGLVHRERAWTSVSSGSGSSK